MHKDIIKLPDDTIVSSLNNMNSLDPMIDEIFPDINRMLDDTNYIRTNL